MEVEQKDQKFRLIELEASLAGVHETVFQNSQRKALSEKGQELDHSAGTPGFHLFDKDRTC